MRSIPGLSTVPVIVVVSSMICIYFTTLFFFIDRWFGLLSSPGILNSVVFTAVSFVCVFNYALVVSTDPGRVPSSYRPDIEDADIAIHEIKRKRAEVRYCQKCKLYKPPRAHHCRVCRRCVLRMDHHCVWINNCVGHENYKVFFVFVLYAAISCFYSLVLLCGSLTVDPQKDLQQTDTSITSIYFVSVMLLIPLSLALGTLLGWHIYYIAHNKTTIEYHEGVRAVTRRAHRGGPDYRHPYDIGTYENLTTVLGPNIFCWVCPSSRHIGSGLRFRTVYDQAR